MELLAHPSLLFDALFDPFIGADEGLVITLWNKAAEKQFGWTAEEALGRPVREVLRSEFTDSERDLFRTQIHQHGHEFFQGIGFHKNGQRLELRANVVLLKQPDGTIAGYALTVRDVTGLKQPAAQPACPAPESPPADYGLVCGGHAQPGDCRMTSLVEGMQGSFVALDHDWRFIYANKRYCEIINRDARELIGKNIWEVLPLYRGTVIEENYRTAMYQRVAVHFKLLGAYSGKWYEASVYPTPDGISIFGTDRTEEYKAEIALRKSEGRFRQLADVMPQLVWTAEADGTFDYFNQRYQEYDGIVPLDDRRWDWQPVVHPDDLQPTLDAWTVALKTGTAYQFESRARLKDGSYRWHLSRCVPVRDEDGKVTRWLGTATDIDDQKRYEDRLRRSNQELEQFAFVASHDLQEPLRKIRQFGRLVQQRLMGQLDRGTQDYLTRIIHTSDRMQTMIQDLLELSRVSTQGRPFEPVDVAKVAGEVLSDLGIQIHRTGGRVELGPLPVIEADPIQIHEVLQNLISNALKFHRAGVPPLVKVSSELLPGEKRAIQKALIRVEDNGIGFDEALFEQILQPFKRLHGRSQYEGTGMGLAIVKKIIERHQGELTARSTPGEGSVFQIMLPVKQK